MTDLNTLLKLAQTLNVSEKDMKGAQSAASRLESKSEDEILDEIMKMKASLTKDRASFNRQLNLLRGMRPMLGREQRQRFDRLIGIIEKW